MPGRATASIPPKRAVFEEIVNGMIGICDEVANGKMLDPFVAADPSLEESPYSQNSLTDFKNKNHRRKKCLFRKIHRRRVRSA
jgi:hypothetical protein